MSMLKGYYLHSQSRQSLGVAKKIDMQIKEFSKYCSIDEIEISVIDRNLIQRILGLFPTASIKRNYDAALEKIKEPSFIYIRRMVADRQYLQFLKRLRANYPNCKILIELYTYPYDKDEFAKWNSWPFYLKELIYRNRQKKYIDRFVTLTDDKYIFGAPTIKIMNGIDVNAIKTVGGEFVKDRISLIGVAYMQRHHGYERIIEGLRNYYSSSNPKTEVSLTLVGDGPEKALYQKLVDDYGLEKHVTFYPNTSGAELDELYDKADIGVASLGMYKLGLYGKSSVLKSREYLAKGMLMLLGCPIDVIDDDYKYAFMAPNDDTPINISGLVDFYNAVCEKHPSKEECAEIIRGFAIKTVDNSIALKPIVDYIG